ncbi:uncharacterized protein [Littorina saxatilis]
MLDMGFKRDICKGLFEIHPDRQTVMTSATWLADVQCDMAGRRSVRHGRQTFGATWSADVQQLANQYMKKSLHIHVGSLDLAAVSPWPQLEDGGTDEPFCLPCLRMPRRRRSLPCNATLTL